MVKNSEFHKHTKLANVHFHLLYEFQSNHEIFVTYVCTQDQYVDIMTKPLLAEKFQCFHNLLGLATITNTQVKVYFAYLLLNC